MTLFAYSLGSSLAPVLVGFILALEFIRSFFKSKLVKQLKWLAYTCSVLLSAIFVTFFSPISGSANVVIGVTTSFLVTVIFGQFFKK